MWVSRAITCFLGWLLLMSSSCISYRYIDIETCNPGAMTFPAEMRRVLIVNHALPQQDVPFESTVRQLSPSMTITADSTAFDFCRTLGGALSEFPGFDDVRLLEGCFRQDESPLSSTPLSRKEVERLSDEHEVDIVISLDRLLFRLNEYYATISGVEVQGIMNVEVSGVLRVYKPDREVPLTTILLVDTITPDLWFEQDDKSVWDLFFSSDPANLLRESASFLAYEARKHFVPYWEPDIRWYFGSYETKWKEAAMYAEAERWDSALAIWRALYEGAASAKKKAYLASNIALAEELMGDLPQALAYATTSHQLMSQHFGADKPATKMQEIYINVLTARIAGESKLRLQIR